MASGRTIRVHRVARRIGAVRAQDPRHPLFATLARINSMKDNDNHVCAMIGPKSWHSSC